MQSALFFQCPDWKTALKHQGYKEIVYEQGLYPNDEQWVRVQVPEEPIEEIAVFARFGDHHDLDRQIFRLFLILESLSRHAGRITLTMPYVPYSLQSRDVRGGDAIAQNIFIEGCLARGVKSFAVADIHSPESLSGFDVPFVHLPIVDVFCDALQADLGDVLEAVIAPDKGALLRAESFGERLGVPVFTYEKTRHGAGDIALTEKQAQDLPDHMKNVIIVDDIINTGSTLVAVAQSLKDRGKHVWCAATHGLFAGMAYKKLQEAGVERVYVSDSFDASVMRLPKLQRALCRRVVLHSLFV